jgi:hydrogenase maturation protease
MGRPDADRAVRPAPPQSGSNGGTAVTVLGIGNILWADEGFGVRCVETMQQRYEIPAQVHLIDGGTQGLYLIHHVQQAQRLLIFDAVDYGVAPGTLVVVEGDDVPKYLGAKKMSLHQTGFQEVLALAQLTGSFPRSVVLIGCQPEELEDYGGSLRPSVKRALEEALARAWHVLANWGVELAPRAAPLATDSAVTLPHLALARYESERPSEETASRSGDPRFL